MRTVGKAAFLTLGVAVLAGGEGARAGDLTYEDRVNAQETIERVYYAHQIGATLPFEKAVSRDLLEAKVTRYLKESRALEVFWNEPITEGMLHEELDRMARESRMPGGLIELYAALGNDPLLIQECLVRPVLVNRRVRQLFQRDGTIHAHARQEIESIREALSTGRINPWVEHPSRTVVTVARQSDHSVGPEGGVRDTKSMRLAVERVELEDDDFERWRAELDRVADTNVTVRESEDACTAAALLDKDARSFRVALYRVPKVTWNSWWTAHKGQLDPSAVRTVAKRGTNVPRPVTAGTSAWTPPGGMSQAAGQNQSAQIACPTDDSWSPYLPGGRGETTVVWTGSVMIVWGGQAGSVTLQTGGRYDPITDSWTPTSTAGAPTPRRRHIAVWTGSVMVVWGGLEQDDPVTAHAVNTGGRYDPVSDAWSPTTTLNAPSARQYLGAWSGRELIVWAQDFDGLGHEGGRYDPVADAWVSMSTANAPPPLHGFTAIRAGSVFIVWGGYDAGGTTNTGGRYDPDSDTWMPTSTAGAPSPRDGNSAIWTGREMIVWGGWDAYANVNNTGGRYDPVSDSWVATSTSGAPQGRAGHSAVWTGSAMIVWGGVASTSSSPLDTGGIYEPDLDRWTPTSVGANKPAARYSGHKAVWTGSLMVIFGGGTPGIRGTQLVGSASRFDPLTNSWLPPGPQGVQPRTGASTVWTGSLMLVWGGIVPGVGVQNTGGKYDPALDAWTPTSTVDAPSPRAFHSTVWTGDTMIVWGGTGAALVNTGGRYDPIADRWVPTSTVDAPSVRSDPSVVWTGREMIIWGGKYQSLPDCCNLNTGGRYDPATDTWNATSTLNAPIGRFAHTATWIGTSMIVWGGSYFYLDIRNQTQYVYLNSGGKYDPATDSWSPISTVDAPPPRARHTAIWTGSQMIVWGGDTGGFYIIESRGGRYDPALDAWTPTSTTDGPTNAAPYTSIVWTGNVMIVWGQSYLPTDSGLGGRYDPVVDTWRPTTSATAPQPGPAVWADGVLLVWRERVYRYTMSPDGDHDGFGVCGGDCDDSRATVNPGASEVCNGVDDNCSGAIDEGFDLDGDKVTTCGGDCNDADPAVWRIPDEVTGLTIGLGEPTPLSWDSQGSTAGPETVYDLVAGEASISGGIDYVSSFCLQAGLQENYVDDRPGPASGSVFWYLVRGRNSCGAGTYGSPARDSGVPTCP
jgi:N-acetylneuraminic acid mutarotase